MELKVWVEGIPRVVCGVSESTTCQEIVHALALAIGKTGCYNLTEKWRETERLLAPSDCPIQSLHNWGEYAPDVQYVLRHTGDKQRRTDRPKSRPMAVGDAQNKLKDVHHNILMRPVQNTNIKRNLTFSGAHSLSSSFKSSSAHLQSSSQDDSSVESVEEERSSFTSFSSKSFSPYASLEDHPNNHRPDIIDHVLSSSEHSGNSIRDKQGSSKSTFSQSDTSNMIAKKSNQRLLDSNVLNYQKQEDQVFKSLKSLLHKQAYRENNQHYNFDERSENVKLQLECNEREKLVQLLNQQLNHLCSQDVAMQKLQAEISSLEEYSVIEPSYEHEICQLEEADEQLDSHIQELELVCWEEKLSMELNKRDELSKEIITIRQKLSVCEKDLEKCKKQLSTLSDEVALDTNLLKQKEENDVKNLEIKLQKELVHLQQQIHEKENEFAISTEDLKAIEKEMEILQHQIQNKILEEKHLDTELKGVNLEEFQVTPHIDKADIEKNTPFLNSATRPGSARKILYNPVALQEAISVNTSQPCWV